MSGPDPTPTFAEVIAAAPPPLIIPGAREQIRQTNIVTGRRIAVLDDDPTGSQSVHDVEIALSLDRDAYAEALAEAGSTCFLLTNSRSLSEPDADQLNRRVAADLYALTEQQDAPLTLVSRSDSTLRGYLQTEIRALDAATETARGAGVDGVLLVPAFLEAGRFTAGDIHWARVDGELVPVGETEFARDASFGYRSSDLKQWVSEKTGGAVAAEDVLSVGLDDLRSGGPDRVAEILARAKGGAFVVVNAVEFADLDVAVLGLQQAEAAGQTFLHRSGPSYVRSLAGVSDQGRLRHDEIWPEVTSVPGTSSGQGHGLIVVGSHVGLTNQQLAVVADRADLAPVELSVPELLDDTEGTVRTVADRVREQLVSSHVLLQTSREVIKAADADGSLGIARRVSGALSDVVAAVREVPPAWVIAKGGITSHDVAVRGMGIRRARVLGQLLDGQVSVFSPVEVDRGPTGVPYVVFAGNVGSRRTLSDAIDVLSGVVEVIPD